MATCKTRKDQSVLIVDNDGPVRRLIATLIAECGYRTIEAENGFEAVRAAEMNRIDLLLTEVGIPGLSGPKLILLLQERDLVNRWLLVTDDGSEDLDPLRRLRDPLPFLKKPFTPQQLMSEVQALLNQS
jgi:DNA-binding response OmpR family regulator